MDDDECYPNFFLVIFLSLSFGSRLYRFVIALYRVFLLSISSYPLSRYVLKKEILLHWLSLKSLIVDMNNDNGEHDYNHHPSSPPFFCSLSTSLSF